MKVAVEEAVEKGEGVGVGVGVVTVAVVDLTEIQITMKLPSLAMDSLDDPDHLKMGRLLRDADMVHLVLVSVAVAVAVIATGKMEKVNALEGCMNGTVALVAG